MQQWADTFVKLPYVREYCGLCPIYALYPGICLTSEEK